MRTWDAYAALAQLPAIVFVSSFAAEEAGSFLDSNGFAAASVTEPLMQTDRCPEPVPTELRIGIATGYATDDALPRHRGRGARRYRPAALTPSRSRGQCGHRRPGPAVT